MTASVPGRVSDHIAHILDAIERIERYLHVVDWEAFAQSTLVQDAVIRNLEVIGEASNKS